MRNKTIFVLLSLLALIYGDRSFDEAVFARPQHGVYPGGKPPPQPPSRPPPPPPAPPRPRPVIEAADDALWDKSGAKGCTLGWGMQATDLQAGALYVPQRDTARSPFDSPGDLITWLWRGYPKDRVDEYFHDLYRTWGIGWALADLGVDPYTDYYDGKNNMLHIGHQTHSVDIPLDQQAYMVKGKLYRATGASYSFTINPQDGIIITLNRESPRYAGKDRQPPVSPEQMPELSQFSDVAWISWKHFSGQNIRNIKYFLSSMIVNHETRRVLKRALEANGWELSEWPGHTFERIWPETKAILGTPNVQGFAYFLIQHKQELGSMYIDKIQVFNGGWVHEKPCILMHVRQPLPPPAAGVEHGVREEDGRHFVREHVVRAK